jgi:hypothetical protein
MFNLTAGKDNKDNKEMDECIAEELRRKGVQVPHVGSRHAIAVQIEEDFSLTNAIESITKMIACQFKAVRSIETTVETKDGQKSMRVAFWASKSDMHDTFSE